ncbi:imidazole glycerol phosphate synthase subunit HisH [Hyphobacterium sp.]|uniref:imidazole glycerol phosphate synthase subunit HisH n=1 Tax=Hyphobacterium sp. TaxID=2004662 RepID=UPI003BAD5E9E
MTVALIDTGCANIFSVQAALDRMGVGHTLAAMPGEADKSERLILPGVGAAGPAMARLNASGWADALHTETRPLMGICLGMQLLFERSAEGDVETLGLIPGEVKVMQAPSDGVLPHMGWNQLAIDREDPLLSGIEPGAYVYFVHGYAAPVGEHTLASCDYGGNFSATIRSGNVMGCQFHPERSAVPGAQILKNFLELTA